MMQITPQFGQTPTRPNGERRIKPEDIQLTKALEADAPKPMNPWKVGLTTGLKNIFSVRGLLWDSAIAGICVLATLITGGLSLMGIPFVYVFGALWRLTEGTYRGYKATKEVNSFIRSDTQNR